MLKVKDGAMTWEQIIDSGSPILSHIVVFVQFSSVQSLNRVRLFVTP